MEKMPRAPPPDFDTSPPPSYSASVPPPPMPPPMPPPTNVVVVTTTAFGRYPQNIICPHCRTNIITCVESEANSKTHTSAVLLCLLGGVLCAMCPYFMDSCLVHKHYCPACRSYLGQCDN